LIILDFGLSLVNDWSNFDPKFASNLASLYQNSVENLDAYIGGLIESKTRCFENIEFEDNSENEIFGSLVSQALKDQFWRLRAGDRYWYQNILTAKDIKEIDSTKLSDIIEHSGHSNLRSDIFSSI
jgi:peroxidase